MAGSAFAADVTVNYRGTVYRVQGDQASALPAAGQAIEISYTVDTSIADAWWNYPTMGAYPDALKNLTVRLPESSFQISVQAGAVQTFNEPDRDLLIVFCNVADNCVASGSTLGGLPIYAEQVVFGEVEEVSDPTKEPTMLTSDAIPTSAVRGTNGNIVYLNTEAGVTAIIFGPSEAATVGELVVDGNTSIAGFVASGAIKAGVGKALSSKLADTLSAFAAGNTAQACLAWKGFSDQVNNLPAKQITPAAQAELQALAVALRGALGGC